MQNKRWSHWAITIILLSFILIGSAYSIANPLFEATDELRHYRFVQHIIQRQSLPIQGSVGCSAQGHHPPLFYSAAALATAWVDSDKDVCFEPQKNPFWAYRYWEIGNDNKNQYLHGQEEAFPWSGYALAAHLTRMVNILIGAAVVWVTWAIGRAIWPSRPYLAVGGAAIVAFNPMFLFMSGAINNDVIAALAGASITLASARLVRDEQGLRASWGVILGVLFGLALLSKFNLAAIIVTIELAILWVALRKNQWRQWVIVNLLLIVFALLIAGWWFLRNQMLYGEPTGFQRLTQLWGARNPADSLGIAIFELPYLWTSLWGRFGYGQIPLPELLYDILWWFTIIAASGILIPLILRQKDEINEYGVYVLLLFVNVALFFAVIFNYLLVSPAGPMGRFFFPALPSAALLLFYGLNRWGSLLVGRGGRQDRKKRINLAITAIVGLCLLIISLIALFGFLAPAYANPPTFTTNDPVPNPVDIQFGPFLKLRGYDVTSSEVHPGEAIDIDLYWEVINQPPGNYLLFVHLIDELEMMVTQRDTHPGLGNFPSSEWAVGDQFVESVRLWIPETAYTPTIAALSVGFYAPIEGYRLAVTDAQGSRIGDAFELENIQIEPPPASNSAALGSSGHNFGDDLMLVDYEYSKRGVFPGDVLTVSLQWRALQDNLPDYQVQLNLLDELGKIVGGRESRPQDGQANTNSWNAGDSITDSHNLHIGKSLPPGQYTVQVAVIDSENGQRVNILAEDGHWIDNKLGLSGIRLLEEP
ncbi:MAG: glycosyltransferase family 39 protein [Candidatus Promineifilaceae bacterium]|nr:glycosyltransferase family 39 protein [Candidatus Promineifilaceae bacterium]